METYYGARSDTGWSEWAEAERLRAWQVSGDWLDQSRDLVGLLLCAERAQQVWSHRVLDAVEKELLGGVLTAGAFPKRRRVWRFVWYRARGITPRDLK